MPQRVQLQRTKGWRMPPNTVKVDRTTRWGNAWRVGNNMFDTETREFRKCLTVEDTVLAFRNCVDWEPPTYEKPWSVGDRLTMSGGYSDEIHINRSSIRKYLRGKNLACWCRLGEPCHADVLLEIANSDPLTNQPRK